MLLRDYFAAAALTGLIARVTTEDEKELMFQTAKEQEIHVREVFCREAYATADAMLAERNKEPE